MRNLYTTFKSYLNETNSLNDIDTKLFKLLNRVGSLTINYKDTVITLYSERSTFDNKVINMWLQINSKNKEVVTYHKDFDIIEDIITQIKEKIELLYTDIKEEIETNKIFTDKIEKGAKYFKFRDIKKLLKSVFKHYIGSETNALSGSDYILFNNYLLRFSDHERPYNSKWNYIHGEKYINIQEGLYSFMDIYNLINNFLKNEMSDEEKIELKSYFNEMPIPTGIK